MKILLFYTPEFRFKPFKKVLPDAPEAGPGSTCSDAVTVFYHVEEADAGREEELARKCAKNIKWLAGKFASRTVVLHSFNHLSSSSAPPVVARTVALLVEERLARVGFTVHTTPFGYFNEFHMHVAGESLAKVFKEF